MRLSTNRERCGCVGRLEIFVRERSMNRNQASPHAATVLRTLTTLPYLTVSPSICKVHKRTCIRVHNCPRKRLHRAAASKKEKPKVPTLFSGAWRALMWRTTRGSSLPTLSLLSSAVLRNVTLKFETKCHPFHLTLGRYCTYQVGTLPTVPKVLYRCGSGRRFYC